MTLEQLVRQLNEGQEVSFPESKLSAPTVVLQAIAEALSRLVPPTESLAYGTQLASLVFENDQFVGTVEWLLALPAHIVRVTASLDYSEPKPALRVNWQIHPLGALRHIEVETTLEHTNNRFYLRSASVEFVFPTSSLKAQATYPAQSPNALLSLARAVGWTGSSSAA